MNYTACSVKGNIFLPSSLMHNMKGEVSQLKIVRGELILLVRNIVGFGLVHYFPAGHPFSAPCPTCFIQADPHSMDPDLQHIQWIRIQNTSNGSGSRTHPMNQDPEHIKWIRIRNTSNGSGTHPMDPDPEHVQGIRIRNTSNGSGSRTHSMDPDPVHIQWIRIQYTFNGSESTTHPMDPDPEHIQWIRIQNTSNGS